MLDKIKDIIKNDWRIPLFSGILFIQTKSNGIQPFIPNSTQEKVINKIWELEQAGKPIRLVIPKARQHGITTLIMAIIFVKTTYFDNQNAIILAHLDDVATEIFTKAQLMYDYLPVKLKVKQQKSNAKEIKYYNHSKIKVKSAESKRQRGMTAQLLLCSEVAFYSDSEKLMTGLLQTIPDSPGTMIIMESTGNGVGGYFYDMCHKALNKQNNYELIFLSWFENNEYQLPLTEKLIYNQKYGDEEYYQKEFNLSDEQINWRRYQIDNKFNGSLMNFMQEYPATLEECFISSGLPVFDIMKLNAYETECISPDKTGFIENNEFRESLNGWLKIFKGPETFKEKYKNRFLVVLDTGGVWDGADYSIALVFDRVKKEVVAIARGHFESFEFADIAVCLCKMYDNATLAIEINKWASETEDETSLLDKIINHIKYPYLYKRKSYDKLTNAYTQKIGFHTNSATKKLIIDKLRQIIKDNDNVKFNDVEIIKEMKTYIIAQSKSGRTQYQAQEGCKDDRVMATGIALVVDDELLKPVRIEEKKYAKTNTDHYSVF